MRYWCGYIQRVVNLISPIKWPFICPGCNRKVYRTAGHHWELKPGESAPIGEF